MKDCPRYCQLCFQPSIVTESWNNMVHHKKYRSYSKWRRITLPQFQNNKQHVHAVLNIYPSTIAPPESVSCHTVWCDNSKRTFTDSQPWYSATSYWLRVLKINLRIIRASLISDKVLYVRLIPWSWNHNVLSVLNWLYDWFTWTKQSETMIQKYHIPICALYYNCIFRYTSSISLIISIISKVHCKVLDYF